MSDKVRKHIRVRGTVQGVGFRPFVLNLAKRLEISGFVRNTEAGVEIEAEGSAVDAFVSRLRAEAPVLARVGEIQISDLEVRNESGFEIRESGPQVGDFALVPPDIGTCEACFDDIATPGNRRYLYPFTNCTNCGPRYTIIRDVPYDRPATTMAEFAMCPACAEEYHNPEDRRFHAQPNACPVCGPRVSFSDWSGHGREAADNPLPGEVPDPFTSAARALAAGAILALKGLGGYHLACDALQREAVMHLRQRKHREAKPFALMVPDLATAQQLCEVNAEEAALLQSYRRPIVLLKRKAACPVAPGVAPAHDTLGIMLPYTPLHALLMQRCAEVFPRQQPIVLVMTSGNVSDEPIAYQDDDAAARLRVLADGMLSHNRAIHIRCDDSVLRVTSSGTQFFRRARGYVPEPLTLAWAFPVPLLACGAHLKNTFCLARERQVFVSHHIGDLENLETLLSFREGIAHFQHLFGIHPEALAYDLHPEYLATHYTLESSIPRKIGVQHHHAHIASVMAEHGLSEPVIGIAADGTGYGIDGAIWGGEILVGDLLQFERPFHLAYMPLPGGEQAVRQPWRMGAVYLHSAYGDDFLALDIPFARRLDRQKWHFLSQMIARGLNSPLTSSMGRLFDAVAALLGLCDEVLYEGQAAIELERQANLARSTLTRACYPFLIDAHTGTMDVAPLIRAIVRDLE